MLCLIQLKCGSICEQWLLSHQPKTMCASLRSLCSNPLLQVRYSSASPSRRHAGALCSWFVRPMTGYICRLYRKQRSIPTWVDRSPRWSTPPKTPGAPDRTLHHLGVKTSTLGPRPSAPPMWSWRWQPFRQKTHVARKLECKRPLCSDQTGEETTNCTNCRGILIIVVFVLMHFFPRLFLLSSTMEQYLKYGTGISHLLSSYKFDKHRLAATIESPSFSYCPCSINDLACMPLTWLVKQWSVKTCHSTWRHHLPERMACLPFVDLSRAERFGIEESNHTSGLRAQAPVKG